MAARGAAWRRRSDGCVRCYGWNVRPSQCPLPSLSTIAHSAQRWQGPASGGASCTSRRRSGRPPLTSRNSSSCRSTKSLAVPGNPFWVSRGGHRRVFCGTSWSIWLTSVPSYRFSMLLCRRWRTNCCKSSGTGTVRCPSMLSTCPRSHITVFNSVWWTVICVIREVPTVLSPSLLQQLSAEQIVDIPVRSGGRGSSRFSSRTGFNSFILISWRHG